MEEIEELMQQLRKARETYKEEGEEDPVPIINLEKKLREATERVKSKNPDSNDDLQELFKKYLGEKHD